MCLRTGGTNVLATACQPLVEKVIKMCMDLSTSSSLTRSLKSSLRHENLIHSFPLNNYHKDGKGDADYKLEVVKA